nr:MAG TPA: KilAC domain protein [Caudoviricetes sp.]
MNELKIFNNNQFGQIRTTVINDEPYFMLKDVCEILEIKNQRDAKGRLSQHGVGTTDIIDSLGRTQQATFINESNLYKLAFTSRKKEAEAFTDWVTSEVLPSIRKTGQYSVNIPKSLPDALRAYASEVEAHNQSKALLEAQRPKVLFADSVAASHTSILIGELAKLLHQNGVKDMGQKRLFAWMREHGYLISRKANDYNMPTQRAMELGLFQIKETTVTHSDGHISVSKTPKVTGKGQQYFIEKFLGRR